MTNDQLNALIDTNIGNKTAAGSITPAILAATLKAIVAGEGGSAPSTYYAITGTDQALTFNAPEAFYFTGASSYTIGMRAKLATGGSIAIRRLGSYDVLFYPFGGNPIISSLVTDTGDVALLYSRDNGNSAGGTPLAFDVFYDIAVTYNSTNHNILIYVNGVDKTDVPNSNSGTFTAFKNTGAFGVQGADGVIDDLYFVNRLLTPAEVAERYNGGSPKDITTASFYADVISYFKFNGSLVDTKGAHNATATTPLYI